MAAAFEKSPTNARFYLRQHGATKFSRLAPAIVVHDDTLDAMRQRFISELDLLIAVGGQAANKATSGTVAEIKLALSLQVPVLVVPQAGGDAADFVPLLAGHIKQAFNETSLADAVRQANERIAGLSPSALPGFADTDLPELVGDVIAKLMGAGIRRSRDAIDGAPGNDW